MSKDVAALAQALGTVAKFTRVMRDAELPDEFYQRAIDDRDFRSGIVRLAHRKECNVNELKTKLNLLLKQVEDKLAELGIKVEKAKRDTHLNLSPGPGWEFLECGCSAEICRGPVKLIWGIEIKDWGGGLEGSVQLIISFSEMERWWSLNLTPDEGGKLLTDFLSYEHQVMPREDRHVTAADLTSDELWFMGHCRFMDKKFNRYVEEKIDEVPMTAGLRLVEVMAETFKSCPGYFDRERTAGETACPRCGGKAAATHDGMFPGQVIRQVYECSGACTMKVEYVDEPEPVEQKLEFSFDEHGFPIYAYPSPYRGDG